LADKIRIPNQTRSIETKRQIIEGSIKLFSENGYYKTSSNQISKTAGVAIGSFYSYFKDKKQLLIEAIRYYDEQIRKGMETEAVENESTSTNMGVRETIVYHFIYNTIQAHKINPAFHREITAVSILDSDIQKLMHEQEKREMEHIYGLLNMWASEIRITDLQTAAALLYFTVEKIAHAVVFSDSSVDEEKLIRELTNMILRYLF